MISTLIKRGFRSNSIANKKMDLKSFFSLWSFHKKFNKFLVENFTPEKKEEKKTKGKKSISEVNSFHAHVSVNFKAFFCPETFDRPKVKRYAIDLFTLYLMLTIYK